jgi:N-acyl-D-amino-acid deacylase
MRSTFLFFAVAILFASCKFHHEEYDKIIHNGMIYDGNGKEPFKGDIGIKDDTIAFIGDLSGVSAQISVDAKGMAVAPGFINMMGHSEDALIQDGRGQSDIRQGVTTEI